MTLIYLTGDAINTPVDGPKIIAHVTNDSGGWGRGFVVPLGEKYPKAEKAYRRRQPQTLGFVQFVLVEPDPPVIVANMCAQHGYKLPTPLDYDALETSLIRVGRYAMWLDKEFPDWDRPVIHMPRIGAGLGGGSWRRIEQIIMGTVVALGLDVTVFDLPRPDEQEYSVSDPVGA